MELRDLKQDLDNLGRDWKAFREEYDKRIETVEKDRGVAELDEKIEKIEESMDSVIVTKEQFERSEKIAAERVEELEEKIDLLLATGGNTVERKDLREYREKWDTWMRSFVAFGKQGDAELMNELREMSKSIPELKAFNTTVGATGGVAVPEQIGREIHDQVRLISPFRDLVRLVNVGTPDYKELVNVHGESSAWVGEGSSRSETDASNFRERAPTKGTLYAYPQATEESLQDMFFDVGGFVRDVTADEFAIQEETAFLTGNGTNKPTGILNGTPVTTDDDASPQRSAEVIEYIPIGTNSPVSAIDPDALLDMVYGLRRPYRMRATWTMNSVTTGTVRKIKMDGEYAWAPGLQAGEPSRLLGFATRTLEGMDDPTLGNHPILFGDFKRGYLFIVIGALRVTVDDNITAPGFIKWYLRERVGGILLDNNAIKAGKYDDN